MRRKIFLKIFGLVSVVTLISILIVSSQAFAVSSPAFSNWYWTNDTNASIVVVGDANNDNVPDIVVAGYYNDGNGWRSQVHVLDSSTYATENVGSWAWGTDSQITSVAVGDVNADGKNEIVTGGTYFDGTRWNSLVSVQNCSSTSISMTTLNIGSWYQGVGSEVSSVVIGDVNGDGLSEIVAGGSFNNGTGWNSLVNVINCSTTTATLNMLTSANWTWGVGSEVSSVVIGDVNGDGLSEIVAGGSFNDGVRSNSLLHVLLCAQNFSALTILNYGNWYWTSNTYINSVAVANITGTTGLSIIAGGSFFDGARYNSVVHVLNCTLATPFFTVQQAGYWVWTGDTKVSSVAVGNFTGKATYDIVTGGGYYDGSHYIAQFMVLDSSNLVQRVVTNWFTTSNTQINSVVVGVTPIGTRVFAAGSYFDNIRSVAQLTMWA